MTNHPNRSRYDRIIAKLQGVSVNSCTAPDCRRLAVGEYQTMIAAKSASRGVKSKASYYNLYGNAAAARGREDREAIEEDRHNRMDAAQESAERFIEAWGL